MHVSATHSCHQLPGNFVSDRSQRPPPGLPSRVTVSRILLHSRRPLPATATASAAAGAADSHHTPLQAPEGIKQPMTTGAVQSEDERRKKLWFAAIKPPMYTVAIIPILVRLQCSIRLADTPVLHYPPSIGCCCSCILYHGITLAQQMLPAERSFCADHCLAQS